MIEIGEEMHIEFGIRHPILINLSIKIDIDNLRKEGFFKALNIK